MEPTKRRIAKIWKDSTGHACFVCKQGDAWWLRLEHHEHVIREVQVATPAEALALAEEWRRTHAASA